MELQVNKPTGFHVIAVILEKLISYLSNLIYGKQTSLKVIAIDYNNQDN